MNRQKRNILLIGTPNRAADMAYATGFRAPDPVVFLQAGQERYLVVSPLEAGRAIQQTAGITVYSTEQLVIRRDQRRNLGAWAAALLRQAGLKRVHVPACFPVGPAEYLRKRGVRVHVIEGAVFPERAVKSLIEIARLRQSQQAAVLAMRAAIARIEQSHIRDDGFLAVNGKRLTSEDIQALILRVALQHNCIARDTIVACGRQGADPHHQGSGPLQAHQPIVIDIFPEHLQHGYWGDITRTVVRGRASRRVRQMYLAVKAAQYAALVQVRSGVKAATVHKAAAAEFQKRGFKTTLTGHIPEGFIHSTGHGVGLEIHEAPGLGLNDTRLRCGHVCTVEPGIYYRETGGVRIEDTIVVNRHGWQYLVPCEKRFEI